MKLLGVSLVTTIVRELNSKAERDFSTGFSSLAKSSEVGISSFPSKSPEIVSVGFIKSNWNS